MLIFMVVPNSRYAVLNSHNQVHGKFFQDISLAVSLDYQSGGHTHLNKSLKMCLKNDEKKSCQNRVNILTYSFDNINNWSNFLVSHVFVSCLF